MRTSAADFVKDESGATAIEYALIGTGIAVAIIVAVNSLGGTLAGLYSDVNTQLGGK
jgi:pilus assembly protein Flp/PilA